MLTDRQTHKQTNITENNTTLCARVMVTRICVSDCRPTELNGRKYDTIYDSEYVTYTVKRHTIRDRTRN